MKIPFKSFWFLTCLVSTAIPAFGWDNPAHMAVAGLAYDELSPPQQQRLVAILKQHPDLAPITVGFPNGVPGDRELVMAAATWPDLIKMGHPEYQNNGYENTSPAVTEVRFDHLQHKGWHFIDQPVWVGHGPAPATLPPVPPVNAVGVIRVLIQQLGSDESDAAKAYDFAWLEHLVGDLHQPLHAATGISEVYPNGDVGGNNVRLAGDTHAEPELHAYWDDVLGKTARSDYHTHHPQLDKDIATATQIINNLENLSPGPAADDVNPQDWADESYKMAVRDVYDVPLQEIVDDGGNLQVTLDQNYYQTASADAKARVRLAAHRLAILLERSLGGQ